jgi:AraC-like DNA-binding protein
VHCPCFYAIHYASGEYRAGIWRIFKQAIHMPGAAKIPVTPSPGMIPGSIQRRLLFASDWYTISHFSCFYEKKHGLDAGYTTDFCINFTRTGYFLFHSFRQVHEERSNCILIDKPGCEYSLTQAGDTTGTCTIFRFTREAYEHICEQYADAYNGFFYNNDRFSLLLAATPEAEYLHHSILQVLAGHSPSTLCTDSLVLDLLHTVMNSLMEQKTGAALAEKNKYHHTVTIEKAKAYMLENFPADISLQQLATHCCVSPFHFSRLFKQFCGYSPYQYLQHIRLTHAAALLRTTRLPVADICFMSGFNRLDYFSTAFSKTFHLSPSRYQRRFA